MQDIIDELGLPDVVFHSLCHTSVTYKLKLSGGDIKAVQGDPEMDALITSLAKTMKE